MSSTFLKKSRVASIDNSSFQNFKNGTFLGQLYTVGVTRFENSSNQKAVLSSLSSGRTSKIILKAFLIRHIKD